MSCTLTSFVKEWNYYTRRDSRANIIIANATKRDGSQMRMISLLGMTFLPGTFLAVSLSNPPSTMVRMLGGEYPLTYLFTKDNVLYGLL